LDSDSDEESALPFFAAAMDGSQGVKETDQHFADEEAIKSFFEERLLSSELAETLAVLLSCGPEKAARHFDTGACARSPLHVAAATAAIQRVEGQDHSGLSSLRIEWVSLIRQDEEVDLFSRQAVAARLLSCRRALSSAGQANMRLSFCQSKTPSPFPKRLLKHSQSVEPIVRSSNVREPT